MTSLQARFKGAFDGGPSTINGILFMLLATIGAASLAGIVRHVSTTGLHPFEIAFFRIFFGLLVLAPWFFTSGLKPLHTKRIGMHTLRAVTNVVSMLMFFMAVTIAPLAQIQALAFTAPLFATLLAIVILREKVRLRRWSAMIIGFIGTLVIIRPGVESIDTGSLLALGSAAIWGFTLIVIKLLARTESSITITSYMTLLMAPLALIPAAFYWTWPSTEQYLWLTAGGIAGTLAQLAMSQAFRIAETTAILPVDFLKLIWGALIGYIFFGELVDSWTIIGGIIIFSGATYIAYRERQLAIAKAKVAQSGALR